ncbi:MAG: hypothetical protein PVI21_00705 [Candidatus Woesebacteria bacterium]
MSSFFGSWSSSRRRRHGSYGYGVPVQQPVYPAVDPYGNAYPVDQYGRPVPPPQPYAVNLRHPRRHGHRRHHGSGHSIFDAVFGGSSS